MRDFDLDVHSMTEIIAGLESTTIITYRKRTEYDLINNVAHAIKTGAVCSLA
jgi:hypothetical protein